MNVQCLVYIALSTFQERTVGLLELVSCSDNLCDSMKGAGGSGAKVHLISYYRYGYESVN